MTPPTKENKKGKYVAPRKKEPFKRKFRRFTRKVKRNRLYKPTLFVILCIIIFFIGRGCQSHKDKLIYTELMEAQKTEITNNYEAKIAEMDKLHSEELDNLRYEYETITPEELIKSEAEYIAKVLYGTAQNNTERDQRTVVWCILNRVDNTAYPNTVKEVCEQPAQWMGYSDKNPVLAALYNTALKELETWHNDYRPVSSDYIYMSWSSKEITLRDTYEKSAGTRYWQAG